MVASNEMLGHEGTYSNIVLVVIYSEFDLHVVDRHSMMFSRIVLHQISNSVLYGGLFSPSSDESMIAQHTLACFVAT